MPDILNYIAKIHDLMNSKEIYDQTNLSMFLMQDTNFVTVRYGVFVEAHDFFACTRYDHWMETINIYFFFKHVL